MSEDNVGHSINTVMTFIDTHPMTLLFVSLKG